MQIIREALTSRSSLAQLTSTLADSLRHPTGSDLTSFF